MEKSWSRSGRLKSGVVVLGNNIKNIQKKKNRPIIISTEIVVKFMQHLILPFMAF